MQIHVKPAGAAAPASPLHVTAVLDDKVGLPEGLSEAAKKDWKGEARAWLLLYGREHERHALLGLGAKKNLDAEAIRRAAAVAAARALALGVESFVLDWTHALSTGAVAPHAFGRAAAEGVRLATYRFERFRGVGTPAKDQEKELRSATFLGGDEAFVAGVEEGLVGAEAVCFARDLANAPGNALPPRELAAAAQSLAKGAGTRIACKVFEETELKRLKMGALLGVAKGSSEPARLVHLRYKPKAKRGAKKPRRVVLVGKGLTFDTGGISIKPAARMEEMKFDMCGAAAVLGVFRALRQLDFPHEIHGVIACAENMPDGKAQKPGDVVTAFDGRTIEVLNTDAEGRLVLADALSWASKTLKPELMLDLATLTGAVVVALGHEATGIMGDDGLCRELIAAGEATGERCWQLPLWDVHREMMKSEVADLRNINSPNDGAGSTAGGAFLSYFVGEGIKWAHLDIAGTAWGGKARDYGPKKGAAGVGVRLLLEWLRAL
jgi:leucyl aminopeptidase